jgi:hypothetical protein
MLHVSGFASQKNQDADTLSCPRDPHADVEVSLQVHMRIYVPSSLWGRQRIRLKPYTSSVLICLRGGSVAYRYQCAPIGLHSPFPTLE